MQHIHNSSDSLTQCSFCGREITQDRMVLLDERDQRTVLHVTCKKCNTATLVFISSNNTGSVSMGMVTDMDHIEAASKFRESSVSTDEVIEIHKLVSSCKGNFIDFI